MAYMDYLILNGIQIPLPNEYSMEYADIESDASGETEAGTKQRDVIREGVVTITVSFSVTAAWLQKFSAFKKRAKLTVRYFDSYALGMRETEMFMEGYKAVLVKDTSKKGLWKVSFRLVEM